MSLNLAGSLRNACGSSIMARAFGKDLPTYSTLPKVE